MSSKKKYNRKSLRLKNYDYSLPWWYFVTICTHKHNHIFGNVINGEMQINQFGTIVDNNWRAIPNHFNSTELDEYVIMPNHIHGIITINEFNVEDANYASSNKSIRNGPAYDRTKMLLSKVIQQFKRQCTVEIKTLSKNKNSVWHKSFYDRIIRNDRELFMIRRYIQNNPIKWELEKGEIENLDL